MKLSKMSKTLKLNWLQVVCIVLCLILYIRVTYLRAVVRCRAICFSLTDTGKLYNCIENYQVCLF